jgi:BMFP domain-containing protein YqiC
MKPTDLFNDLQSKVSEALRNSPAKDIEKRAQHDDAGLRAP